MVHVWFVAFWILYRSTDAFLRRGIALGGYDLIAFHIADRFSVDLQRCGAVKLNSNIVPRQDIHHFCVLDMLSFEDRWKYAERAKLSAAVVYHDGNGAVCAETILLGRRHHATAVKTTVHGRRKPNVVILILAAIDGNDRISGLVMEKQSFYGDGRIVHRFTLFFTQFVSNFTAIAIDPVANAVEEVVLLTVDIYTGQ